MQKTGGNGGAAEDTPVDTEQRLEILHAFKDRSKSAVVIEPSPNGRYAAILDAHHRIIIQVRNLGPISKTVLRPYAQLSRHAPNF